MTDSQSPGVGGSEKPQRPLDCSGRLRVFPVSRADANAFVELYHRHNKGLPSDKFAVAVADEAGQVRGVAIAGIPKARMANEGFTLEVSRVCTDGAANACSALYGACVRAAKALGYRKVITYTLQSESGSSLRAAGFTVEQLLPGRSWKERHGDLYSDRHDTSPKVRWSISFERAAFDPKWPQAMRPEPPATLFEEAS